MTRTARYARRHSNTSDARPATIESPTSAAAGRFAEGAHGGWRQVAMSTGTGTLAREVAADGLRLGQVDFWHVRSGPTVVTDWSPIPRLRALRGRFGLDIGSLAVAALVGRLPAVAPPFLAADLEPNLLAPQLRRG